MIDKYQYIAIDLKSFYASVECVELGLDPMTTNLVVADKERTDKTICLAVSPSLKSFGISGRPRLFELNKEINKINTERKTIAKITSFKNKSYNKKDLNDNPSFAVDYIVATPRMALYIQYSAKIYEIYLRYFSKDDIHVYSIDEVFIDIGKYANIYKMPSEELVKKVIKDIYNETKIIATAGIGTNLYLAKVAMDIVAKHINSDKDGLCIAKLDEMTYRKTLWSHTPLTDFWRVGKGYKNKLEALGLYTMGDIARQSIEDDDVLYKLFGVNAELLIDHAWGYEPCTMKHIKAYTPQNTSISSGQVLKEPYDYQSAQLVVKEMTDTLVLDLVSKEVTTKQLVLTIGYDVICLTDQKYHPYIKETITKDYLGRQIIKPAHGTINLKEHTSSTKTIMKSMLELYKKIVNPNLPIRRIYVVANNIKNNGDNKKSEFIQLDLFTDISALLEKQASEEKEAKKEASLQKAILAIKNKYGKNAIIKGMNMEKGATARERNKQIGGHRS